MTASAGRRDAVTFLVKEAHYTLVQAGVLLSMVQFAGAVGRIGWGWIADRLHASRTTLLVLGTLMLIATIATTRIDESWSAIATAIVFVAMGATAIGWNGVFVSEAVRLSPPAMAGSVVGVTTFCTFAGVLAGLRRMACALTRGHSTW